MSGLSDLRILAATEHVNSQNQQYQYNRATSYLPRASGKQDLCDLSVLGTLHLDSFMDTNSFTTAEVANFCRVSDATVKRWESAGLIKSVRTSGGHRRFRAEEIARFQNEQGLGKRQKLGEESVNRAGAKRHADKGLSDCDFFHSLLSGSEEKASSILIERILAGEPVQRSFGQLDYQYDAPHRRALAPREDLGLSGTHCFTNDQYCAS